MITSIGLATTPDPKPHKKSRQNIWRLSLQLPDLQITAPGSHQQIRVVELLTHPAEQRTRGTKQTRAKHQQGAGFGCRGGRDSARQVGVKVEA